MNVNVPLYLWSVLTPYGGCRETIHTTVCTSKHISSITEMVGERESILFNTAKCYVEVFYRFENTEYQ